MLFYALSAFSIATFGLSATGNSILPVITCKRDLVDYSACLKRALKEAWPRFVSGLPEFDFSPLDPLFYEYGRVVFNSGEVHGELIVSNITCIGVSKSRFFDIRTHFLHDVFRLEIDILVPSVFITGDAKLNGTVNIFRIIEEGHLNLTLNDIRGIWNLTGHVVNDTWIVEHFHYAPSLGNFKVYFDNLTEYNKQFSDLVVIFVNEFWPTVYRVTLPFLADVWDPWLVDFPNKLFSKVSFSKIFP